ncbi:MAG: Maf family protein [Ornithinimicrobium sp.]
MITLVLASASSGRLGTLRRAGIDPRVVVSAVDEVAVVANAEHERDRLPARDVALLLARAKCRDVFDTLQGAATPDLVLGCDSVLEFDGEVYGKPHTEPEARRRWQAMRGSSGVLHSGHWLIDRRARDTEGTAQVGGVASTTVHFADLSDAEIDAYIATGEPLHVAGGFTVDGLGGPYVTRIEGDYHAVVGVSLPLVRTLLARFGIDWHELRPD